MEIQKLYKRKKEEIFGPRYKETTVESLKVDPKYIQQISSWTESPSNFLVLMGPPGTGKTYICAALYEWSSVFRKSKHLKEAQYLSNLKNYYDFNGQCVDIIDDLVEFDYLSIDDLGAYEPSEWDRSQIFYTIDTRYKMCLPTVITTNLTLDEISKKYHPGITSRLTETNNVIIDLFGAKDFRK